MTLLVAGSDGDQTWMIADTAITDPKVHLRDRIHDLKIEPIGRASLVGFSGNPDLARRIIAPAREVAIGEQALQMLAAGRRDYRGVELAYSCWDGERASLYKMKTASLRPEKVSALYLGSKSAFERFQKARLSALVEHAPNAVHTLVAGGKSTMSYPDSLRDAIVAMLQTSVVTSDREVGGWPVPYILNRDGVFLVQFGYSVTDPIVDRLQDGDAIPLGTAEAGGVGFSLTEVGDGDGLVAYWLQKPGGYVFLRGVEGITQERFLGKPEEFVDKVYKKLGRRVDLMFGDRTVVNPDHRAALIDDNGNERIRIEGEGGNLVFRWKQGPPSSWQASASGIDLDGPSRRNERSP